MFKVFTIFSDFIVGLIKTFLESTYEYSPPSHLLSAIHFFIEDVTKIFFLLIAMIYLIALVRAGVNTEKIRMFLVGKARWLGYLLAAIFGAVTPFCSCSSIPLFLGFTSAGIPLGITMAFLITSPMINEVAVVLLGSIIGVKFTGLYIATGMTAGILGGFFIDAIRAERFLSPIGQKARQMAENNTASASSAITATKTGRLSMRERHNFAVNEMKDIFSRVWKWVLIGVGLGAVLHGFVPDSWISDNLGNGGWWSVPAAVALGIPLYANASGIIPVAETLLAKGLPVGTTMAFMMSVVAASFPEFMMLKQVMKPKLLVIFFFMLLFFFTAAGWLFNILF